MKVAKSIGLLYKLIRFLPETILKTLYLGYSSIIHFIIWCRNLEWNIYKLYL